MSGITSCLLIIIQAQLQKLCKALDADFVVDVLGLLHDCKLYKRYSSLSMESKLCKILLGVF